MKKLLSIAGCLVCLSAAAQKQAILDTAPLGTGKTVILPTYNNLIKLSGIDSLQMENFLEPYGYVHEGYAGSFSSDDDEFDVYKGNKVINVMFSVKTGYFRALNDDIKKRFPNAVHTTTNQYGGTKETYMITWNDAKGQHIQRLVITEDTVSGGVSFEIVK